MQANSSKDKRNYKIWDCWVIFLFVARTLLFLPRQVEPFKSYVQSQVYYHEKVQNLESTFQIHHGIEKEKRTHKVTTAKTHLLAT